MIIIIKWWTLNLMFCLYNQFKKYITVLINISYSLELNGTVNDELTVTVKWIRWWWCWFAETERNNCHFILFTFSDPPANSNLSTLSIWLSKLVSLSFRSISRFSVSSTLLLKSGTGLESTSCWEKYFLISLTYACVHTWWSTYIYNGIL